MGRDPVNPIAPSNLAAPSPCLLYYKLLCPNSSSNLPPLTGNTVACRFPRVQLQHFPGRADSMHLRALDTEHRRSLVFVPGPLPGDRRGGGGCAWEG